MESEGKKYVFRKGARVKGASAQTVGEELERIESAHGRIDAPLLVETQRPDDAPLHEAFEWRDEVAAEEYRKGQARHIIRSVRVVEEEGTSPGYVYVPSVRQLDGEEDAPAGHYRNAEAVVTNIDEFERAYEYALRQARSAERAVEELKRLASRNGHSDKASMLAVALQAMESARLAIERVH